MTDAPLLSLARKQTLSEIRSTLLPFGIRLKPTVKRTEEVFDSFASETQEVLLGILSDQLTLIKEAAIKTRDRKDFEVSMLKLALKKLDMMIPDRFFDLITEQDVVEIYNLEAKTQLYRNSTFLDKCSYDLLTLMAYPYPDLFERDEDNARALAERSKEVTQQESGPVRWGMEDHYLVEKMSFQKWRYQMKMGWICPVFSTAPESNGERVAWASTLQVERIGFGATQLS